MPALSQQLLSTAGAALILAQLCNTPAWADAAGKDGSNKIVVSAMRHPDLMRYRIMHAGVDAFSDHHALAPQAVAVKFQLRARKVAGTAPYDGLTLSLVGEDTAVPVPLDAHATFVLPPADAVADQDADLVLNKHRGGYNWMPVVRSPGVPDDARRMGDLRLECQVLIAVVKKDLGFMKTVLLDTVLRTRDWCTQTAVDDWDFPSFSERSLAAATLVVGDQRTPLKLNDDHTTFGAPLADPKVPDDALVELQYAEAAP
jgi:hypothetical protein